jgi:hypothetical protein
MPLDASDRHGILRLYRYCRQSFSQLLKLLSRSEPASVATFIEQLGKFNVWAENAGAHQSCRVSLDHQLREALDVKEMVMELLDNLNSDIQDGKL